MHRLQVALFLVVIFSLPMFGQSGKAELFGGYSLERIAGGCGSDYRCGVDDLGATTNLNGWIVSAAGYFYRSLGLSAQLGGNYGSAGFGGGGGGLSSVHRYAYQFGPVYTFRRQRASAFTHALFGGVSQGLGQGAINGRAPSYTAFIWSVGGGIDIKLSKHLSVRAAQIDYERHHVPVEGPSAPSTSLTNGFRYSAGVVLRY
ncbi:MAG: hypothetical protein ACLQBK_03250 [Candidatus Sulfotelmatobacter sp.]